MPGLHRATRRSRAFQAVNRYTNDCMGELRSLFDSGDSSMDAEDCGWHSEESATLSLFAR